MIDEVCTTNDMETMGNYLQFKNGMRLHCDLAFDARVLVACQVNSPLLAVVYKCNKRSTMMLIYGLITDQHSIY